MTSITELQARHLTLEELADRLTDHADPVVRAFAERVINAQLQEFDNESDDDD